MVNILLNIYRKYAAQAMSDEKSVFDTKLMEQIGMKVDDVKRRSNLTPLVPRAFLSDYDEACLE